MRPVNRRKNLLVQLLSLALLIAPVALSGCKQTEGERCQVDADCDDGLRCCYGTTLNPTSEQRAVGEGAVCVAAANCGGQTTPDASVEEDGATKDSAVEEDAPASDTAKPDSAKPDTLAPDSAKPDTLKPDTIAPDQSSADV